MALLSPSHLNKSAMARANKKPSRTRLEINVANNAKLRVNAQRVLALTRAERPKNTSLAYDPKQREFKVPPLLPPLKY